MRCCAVQMKMQDLLSTDEVGKAKKADAASPDDVQVHEERAAPAGPSRTVKDADEGISSPLVVGTGPAAASTTFLL